MNRNKENCLNLYATDLDESSKHADLQRVLLLKLQLIGMIDRITGYSGDI